MSISDRNRAIIHSQYFIVPKNPKRQNKHSFSDAAELIISKISFIWRSRFSDLGHRRPIGRSSRPTPRAWCSHGSLLCGGSANLNQPQCSCWSKGISRMQSAQFRGKKGKLHFFQGPILDSFWDRCHLNYFE